MSHNKETIEIKTWLINSISNYLEIKSDEIDPSIPFESYGVNSSTAVILSGDLQEWLGCSLDPMIFFDYPTVEALADYLSNKLNLDPSKQN
jgi:acyl carrier protein